MTLSNLNNNELIELYKKEVILLETGARSNPRRFDAVCDELEKRDIARYSEYYVQAITEYYQHKSNRQELQIVSDNQYEYKPQPECKLEDRGVPDFQDYIMYNAGIERIVNSLEVLNFATVVGDSMIDIGFRSGDLLLYDTNKPASHGNIVILNLNGYLYVKRYCYVDGRHIFVSENKKYADIIPNEEDTYFIKGVVISKIEQVF